MTRSARRASPRHRLEHLALIAAAAVLVRLPERAATALGSALGWIAGSVLRIRRRTVAANLARAFPNRSVGWRTRVARATYRHFGREAVSLIRFQKMDPAEARARLEVEGLELLRDPVAHGRGVLALVGHFGNWEIAAMSATARGLPIDAVARRQANPLVDEYMTGVRRRLGMGVVYRSEAIREIPRRLAESRVVAMVADQNAARGGTFVTFFGHPAATARGPGVIALRTGVPLVFVDPRRLPGWKARYRVRFVPIQHEDGGSMDERVRRLTRAYMERLEDAIREAPEQYFWFHKRWKTRPEEDAGRPSGEGEAA